MNYAMNFPRTIILSIMVILATFFTPIIAAQQSSLLYNDFEYKIENNFITITGWNGNSSDVNVPAIINNLPVRKIDDKTFYNKKNIKYIFIPVGITEIGERAFWGCENLSQITLPTGLEKINAETFINCKSISDLVIPEGVKEICEYGITPVFLKNVVLPQSLEIIDDYAFQGTKLKEIIIPVNVKKIGDYAFNHCQLTTITFNGNSAAIGIRAFDENPITSIKIQSKIPMSILIYAMDFPNNFINFFGLTQRQAGLYTFKNNTWYLDGKSDFPFGTIITKDGATIDSIHIYSNNDEKSYYPEDFNDNKYLLPPGKYEIGVRYSANGRQSASDTYFDLVVNAGKTYSISAELYYTTALGSVRYSIEEE